MDIIIRKSLPSDLQQVKALEVEVFNMGYTEDFIERLLLSGYSYVALDKDNIIGYILSDFDDYMFESEEIYEYMAIHNDRVLFTVISLAVQEKYRNKKIATALMYTLLADLEDTDIEKVALQVRVSNTHALSLYEKAGFEIVTLIHNYYNDPQEDGYLMIKIMKKQHKK
jgi:[ribosomal protein S18]-alanine N-acetyltransferase